MVPLEAGLVNYKSNKATELPKWEKPEYDDIEEIAKIYASGSDGIKVKDADGNFFDEGNLEGLRLRDPDDADDQAELRAENHNVFEAILAVRAKKGKS